jgi:hypothetical protein
MTRLKTSVLGIALVGALFLGGCGDGGGNGIEPDNPEVIATYPEDGATDIGLNPLIRVWFDQELDEATVDSAAFHVAGAVTERFEYDASDRVVRLYLRELLAPESDYEIMIDSTITSADGDPMAEDRSFGFTTGPMDCDHLEDYLEPNDNIETATDIYIVKAYPLLSSCGDGRTEYYRFDITDTALVTARIEHVYSDDPKPTWYVNFKRATDEAYTWYTGWISGDVSINQRFTFLPGTYYLHTGSSGAADRIVVYNLIIQISAPCLDDSLEDNDFIDEASPITPGLTDGLRGCYRDRDCYSIRLSAGQVLTVAAEQNPDIGSQLTLEILGPDGFALTGGTYQENPATLTWAASQDTSHYIAATYWNNDVDYLIEVEVLSLP